MRPVPLAALALAAFPLFAQERIEVSVVNVDVTVTDHGKPVYGLTREDFEVLDDGAPQTVTNFYAVDDRETFQDDRFRRKVLLLIDSRTMTRFTRDRALARLETYINDQFRTGEYVWSIASMDSSLRILMPPTSDKRTILDALRDIRQGQAPNSATSWPGYGIDAVVEAVRSFATVGGKKVLIVMTGHVGDVTAAAPYPVSAFTRDELIEEANASNVNIYIVNPEGAANAESSMYWIARSTGGKVLTTTKVDQALSQFDTASANFYSLGFSPKHPDDAKYHHLKVRVKKGDYVLQYRDGYFGLSDTQQIERTLGSALGSFWMASGSAIPLKIEFDKGRDLDDALMVNLKTTVPGEQPLGTIDIFVSVFDSDGRSVWQVKLTRDAAGANNFNEVTELYLHKGKPYKVIVAVRDRTSEAVGVTQQVVKF